MARAKHAHHGGSWKVAFADFMTAMFALFLVMWLVGLAPEKKEGIANYFKHHSILKENTGTNSVIPLPGAGGPKQINEGAESKKQMSESDMKNLEKSIKETFKDSPETLKDHIAFEKTSEGLRINLIDNDGQSMFQLGSKELSPIGKEIIDKVAKELKNYSAPLVIEGHTDSLNYTGTQYTNWELSTERALSAKKSLINNGFASSNIESITGYADTKPLVPDNRYDAKNRRISILVKS